MYYASKIEIPFINSLLHNEVCNDILFVTIYLRFVCNTKLKGILLLMKKCWNFLMNKLRMPMTDEQERGYVSTCAKRILHYERIFLLIIMAFQLYNIVYTLLYTKGRLHTVPSRVYMVLYTILLLVSLGNFFLTSHLKKQFPDNARKVVYFQIFYGIFLMLWGVSVTVYDQRVSENISVYLIISLTVAVLVYFTPIQAILTYGAFQFILFWLLPIFKNSTKDSYGENVNLTVMSLMCILISIYRYYYDRKHYLYQQIIIEKNSHLKYLANRDTLTGLRNRRFLEDEMDSLYQRCLRGKIPMTFMMLDIDSFKNYNDQFGHPQGDECLRRIAWRLNNELNGEHEYLIRYGGEEFLYIGMGIDKQAAERKGQHFNKIIRELVIGPSDREPMGITISIGSYTMVCDESAETQEWTSCINEADKALYMAKNSGKDKCVCFPE